jgi:hypothetical protein
MKADSTPPPSSTRALWIAVGRHALVMVQSFLRADTSLIQLTAADTHTHTHSIQIQNQPDSVREPEALNQDPELSPGSLTPPRQSLTGSSAGPDPPPPSYR